MAWKSVLAGHEIPDAKTDAKDALSFGTFRISGKAVYIGSREYLPLDCVEKARLYASQLNSQGCCGLALPVWYVLLYYGAERPLKAVCETKEKAEQALGKILAHNPAIEVMEPNKP